MQSVYRPAGARARRIYIREVVLRATEREREREEHDY